MLYPGDTVRLLRELPEFALARDAEGRVTQIQRGPEGDPQAAEVQFYVASKAIAAAVPFEALELVLVSAEGCTAVFWGLEKPARELLDATMRAMLDRDFEMRQGLNVMQLHYNREERFWRKGNRVNDATGERVTLEGAEWDGCLAAFSGPERFQLEFRLRGKGPPCVFLHERFAAYEEQRRSAAPAMNLLRVLLNLYAGMGAECCAMPVAGNWLMDESWDSLLQQPYFPDLFLIPQSRLPATAPSEYRAQRLVEGKAILTTLPVKFAPDEPPARRSERELKLNQLRACLALGEKAYDQLYDTGNARAATGLYSDAKEAFHDAIRLANELGLKQESEQLSARLEHIKGVFRSQFR
jgi:hypothetical protein